jgi:hypothetical protein
MVDLVYGEPQNLSITRDDLVLAVEPHNGGVRQVIISGFDRAGGKTTVIPVYG